MINFEGIDRTETSLMKELHELFVHNQLRPERFIEIIKHYGNYEFWSDYKDYLNKLYKDIESQYIYFSSAVISYLRIINR